MKKTRVLKDLLVVSEKYRAQQHMKMSFYFVILTLFILQKSWTKTTSLALLSCCTVATSSLPFCLVFWFFPFWPGGVENTRKLQGLKYIVLLCGVSFQSNQIVAVFFFSCKEKVSTTIEPTEWNVCWCAHVPISTFLLVPAQLWAPLFCMQLPLAVSLLDSKKGSKPNLAPYGLFPSRVPL